LQRRISRDNFLTDDDIVDGLGAEDTDGFRSRGRQSRYTLAPGMSSTTGDGSSGKIPSFLRI